MKIDRTTLLASLSDFAQKGHGLVVGKPGIGKTWALEKLSDELLDKGIPSYVLKVDQLDGSDKSIGEELGATRDWIAILDSLSFPNKEVKAVLIFDAFDASRNEEVRERFLAQIRKAKGRFSNWHILVSVRSYDATRSPKLMELFGGRVFQVEGLSDSEMGETLTSYLDLSDIHDHAGPELRSVLRIPFYLNLLYTVLGEMAEEDYDTIKRIQSESGLLDLFYEKRVEHTEDAEQREEFLRGLANALVGNRSISMEKTKLTELVYDASYEALKSVDLVSLMGPRNRKLAFSHNILFDYLVGRLSIPLENRELIEFIAEDPSRQFFLRPSFYFHFSHLWNNFREDFWACYDRFQTSELAEIKLFGKILLSTVIALEFRSLDDLSPLLSSPESIRNLLQSIRFLEERTPGQRDIDLMLELSENLNTSIIWDLSAVLKLIIEKIGGEKEVDPGHPFATGLGLIARNLLSFVLRERNTDPASKGNLDRIGSIHGVSFVGQTYGTDPAASRVVLGEVLELLKEPGFDIWYFTNLSDHVSEIFKYDPDFVEQIYHRIFFHEETSQEKTTMGSIPFTAVSNRSQDFDMCYFRLTQKLVDCLKIDPVKAIQIGLSVVNELLVRTDKDRFFKDSHLEDVAPYSVSIGGIQAGFIPTISSMWESLYDHKPPAKLLGRILEFIEHRSGIGLEGDLDVGAFNEVTKAYLANALVAETWKKFLELGGRYPSVFKIALKGILVNQVILKGGGLVDTAGTAIEKVFPFLDASERLEIEQAILSLTEHEEALGKDEKENHESEDDALDLQSHEEKCRLQLLNCIPSDYLQLDESKALLSEGEEVPNEPAVRSTMTSREYTNRDYLADRGVDFSQPKNKEVDQLLHALQSFNGKWRNDRPKKKDYEGLIRDAVQLLGLVQPLGVYKEELRDSALKEIAEFWALASWDIKEMKDEEYAQAVAALNFCISYQGPYANSYPGPNSSITAYSPTPRINAAPAFSRLLSRNNDEEVFQTIEEIIIDENPFVRNGVMDSLAGIYESRPEDYWEMLYHSLESESVLTPLFLALRNAAHPWFFQNQPEKVLKALHILAGRLSELSNGNELRKQFVVVTLRFLETEHKETALSLLTAQMGDSMLVKALLFSIFENLNPKRRGTNYKPDGWVGDYLELLQEITAANLNPLRGKPELEQEDDSQDRKSLEIIDLIVRQIFYGLDVMEFSSHDNRPVSSESKQQFFLAMKPTISEIVEASEEIAGGIMVAHTGYHLIEALLGVLKIFPQQAEYILEVTEKVVSLSAKTGFTFDTGSIKKIVSLTEIYLADHRGLLQEGESLDRLVKMLNIFSESGWPEANSLLWRLDDVFR